MSGLDSGQLDAIARMFEESAIPSWLREYVIENEHSITQSLDAGQEIAIECPNGDVIRISPVIGGKRR